MAKADLHIHTTFSDGKYSPAEIVEMAKKKSLSMIALADHDSIEGLSEAHEAAQKAEIIVINGVEITSDFNGREAHILAYAFNADSNVLTQFLSEQAELRIQRIHSMLEKLAEMGVHLTFETIKNYSGEGSIGRPHLAKALVEAGFAKSMGEAFAKYIGNHSPAYFKSSHPDYKRVIQIIHAANGMAILAHPGLSYTEKELNDWILQGIDGFEMIHPRHPYHLQTKFEKLANEYGLIKTGGSDFHGFYSKDHVYFGVVTINTLLAQKLVHLQSQNVN